MVACAFLATDLAIHPGADKTLGAFRAGRLCSLVATDVAARGLDIPDIAQVIHFELPVNPTSYVHRAGRTGRAEKEGSTFLILSHDEEREYLRMVQGLRIHTRKLPLPVLRALPCTAVATMNEPPRRSHHHADRAGMAGRRRYDSRENRIERSSRTPSGSGPSARFPR